MLLLKTENPTHLYSKSVRVVELWVGSRSPGSHACCLLAVPPVVPHLNVAESPHVVCTWRQVHNQLCLVGPLTVIGCVNLQLQHIVSTNEKRGVPPVWGVLGLGLETTLGEGSPPVGRDRVG